MENWEIITWALPSGWLIFSVFIVLATHQINFEVNSDNISIKILGLRLRRIPLKDIQRTSKQIKGKPEVWSNTLRTNHRILVIYRKGKLRPIVITPENRYVFRKKIDNELKTSFLSWESYIKTKY